MNRSVTYFFHRTYVTMLDKAVDVFLFYFICRMGRLLNFRFYSTALNVLDRHLKQRLQMADKSFLSSIKLDKLLSSNTQTLTKNIEDIQQKFLNMKTVDITSRLGQFAWRQITPSVTPLPIIFRHNHREEYLCAQMINIHLLSKFPSGIISYCMNQSPIHYFSITKHEAKLFQYINKFHSNGFLSNNNQLDYTRLNLAYITPLTPFTQFYQLISTNSQFIVNNSYWISSDSNKTNIGKKKQEMPPKPSSNKINSSSHNTSKSSNTYCRSILFHEKEIISYSTRSTMDSNETNVCVSLKDIVSNYFPSTTLERFIQLCRYKQIIRYKPETSTHSDLSLRLIDITQLNQYWDFFIEQLLPNTRKIPSPLNPDTMEQPPIKSPLPLPIDNSSNIIDQSFTSTSEIVPSPTQPESSPGQMDLTQPSDDEHVQFNVNCSIDPQIEIIQEQPQQENVSENNIDKERNALTTDSLEQIQDEPSLPTIEKQTVKRKRRRARKPRLTLKKRKQKLTDNQIQAWITKFSIEPISIILQRADLPID